MEAAPPSPGADDAEACPEWENAIGAAVAGWLTQSERASLDVHTARCAGCAAVLAQLTGLGHLLRARAPRPSARRSRAGLEARPVATRRRRRWWVGAAAGVATVAAAVLVLWSVLAAPATRSVEFTRAAPGVSAHAELTGRAGGTHLRLVAAGLHPDTTYTVWLARSDGTRLPVGSRRTDGRGELQAQLVSDLPLSHVNRVWATDPAGATVLAGPVRGA